MSDSTPGFWTGMGAFIIDLGPVLVGLAAVWVSLFSTQRTLRSREQELERQQILSKLNEFYVPVIKLLETSGHFHDIIKGSERYSILDELLKGEQGIRLQGNDRALFEEVLIVTREVDELISAKGGLVEDPELIELLARASAHFRIIRLAHENALEGEIGRFEDFGYPTGLNMALKVRREELAKRLRF